MTPEVVSPPQGEPVVIETLKSLLRIDGDQLDAAIAALVTAATSYLEQAFGCAAVAQTRRAWIDATALVTGEALVLPLWPATAVTSVTTYDTDGTATVLAATDYDVDAVGLLGRVDLHAGVVSPSSLRPLKAVAVVFSAGWAEGSVPMTVVLAIAQLVGHWLEHPEGADLDAPASVRALMAAVAPVVLV